MKQYTFLSEEEFIQEIDDIAQKESRSRSVMINLLLHQAVKERNRKRKNGKDLQISDQSANSYS